MEVARTRLARYDELQHRDAMIDTTNPHGKTKSTNFRLEIYLDDGSNPARCLNFSK